MTVCPTDAIVSPRRLDARRCISYLTIEHKSAIGKFRKPMGNRIYGCDDCQLFCPWNREAPTTTESDFAVRNGLDSPRLVDLFALSKDEFLALTEGAARVVLAMLNGSAISLLLWATVQEAKKLSGH